MQAVVAQFEKVMHVTRRGSWAGSSRTTFSFLQRGKYTPYVTVFGSPELRDGMNVLAVLRNQDDWQSLLGWKDLDTGVLAIRNPVVYRKALWRQGAALVALLFALKMGVPLSILGAGFIILAYGLWTSYRELRQAERDLREIKFLGLPDEA